MAIFSIALRGGVILEELILRMSLSGRAILHRILPRGYILLYAPCKGSVSWEIVPVPPPPVKVVPQSSDS